MPISIGTNLITRSPLGFWFCGLSVLGYLRFFMKAAHAPPSGLDAVAWVWLGGSVLLSVVGVVLIVRQMHTAN